MTHSTLPELDNSLYPQLWLQQTYDNPQSLLRAMLAGMVMPDAYAFTKQLQANNTYQEWINASIFGRYIQRSFAALYSQTEDSFNMDIPALYRNELLRHAQYLPPEQVLFVAGDIPKNARREKLFTTTLNPATVIIGAQNLHQNARKVTSSNNQQLLVNQIKIKGREVLAFPLRHNKRTSERIRNEVLIMNFKDLRLVNEELIENKGVERSHIAEMILLRSYELR